MTAGPTYRWLPRENLRIDPVAAGTQPDVNVVDYGIMILPYPAGCPPTTASPINGTYYRLAHRALKNGESTDAKSWRRPYETKKRDLSNFHSYAFSVLSSLEELDELRGITPWAEKKSVAEVHASQGNVIASPGGMGQSHCSWWTDPHDLIPTGTCILESGQVTS